MFSPISQLDCRIPSRDIEKRNSRFFQRKKVWKVSVFIAIIIITLFIRRENILDHELAVVFVLTTWTLIFESPERGKIRTWWCVDMEELMQSHETFPAWHKVLTGSRKLMKYLVIVWMSLRDGVPFNNRESWRFVGNKIEEAEILSNYNWNSRSLQLYLACQ